MNQYDHLPPGVNHGDSVVFFDGVCRLCSFWTLFLIKFDNKRRFKLAMLQSAEGKAILEWFGLPTDNYETMLLVEGPKLYTKSTAIFRIIKQLPFPWPVFYIGNIIPVFIRNWLYDRIALNRYKLFGRYQTCIVPGEEHKSRFLSI